jgi:CubicO group peptidase (beta-lactamase class C family)
MLRFLLFFSCLPLGLLAQSPTQQLRERLDSLFQASIGVEEPGGSFFIQKKKKILYNKSFGLADLQTKEKFSERTVANTGSISKTIVAYGILLLEQRGKLSLNDKITRYFPDFQHPELVKDITIQHLLTHSSGLPDIRKVSENPTFYLTADDAQNFAPLKATDKLRFEPGTNWEYSNPAFNGLALIIEQVSGMKWQRFIEKYLFKPAGMRQSVITDGAFPQTGVAHGYEKVEGQFAELDYGEEPTFCAAGNGGVWCSLRDLRQYRRAMQSCAFADCALIRHSQTVWQAPQWKAQKPPFMGLSWFVEGKGNGLSIGHTGSQGGFRAHMVWYPQQQLTIIWLSNNAEFYTGKMLKILREEGVLE